MNHISNLCGNRVFSLRNKYGETHLSSLLSWMSHTNRENVDYKTAMPIERWAWSIARIAHQLLTIDRCKSHLESRPISGLSKGLLPIEIINRHKVSVKCRKDTIMFYRCVTGVFAIMDVLLHHGAAVNTRDPDGRNLLHWAAKVGNVMNVWYLIDRRANVDDMDSRGFTPLHLACQIDVHDSDHDARNMAQSRRRLEIIRKLVWHGADINAKTDDGLTPLFIACQSLDCKVVAELLRLGAEILEDNNGRTPQDAVRHAEQKYADYQLGAIGALSRILFRYGDTDYVYDPREELLDILSGPDAENESQLIGRDIEPRPSRHFLQNAYLPNSDPDNPVIGPRWCEEISHDIEGDYERVIFCNNFVDFDLKED